MGRVSLAQGWFWIKRLDPHLAHEPLNSLMIDGIALIVQVNRHARPAIERRPHILLIEQPHQVQVEWTFGGWHIIIGGTVQIQQVTLLPYTQRRMGWLNQGTAGRYRLR